MQLNEKGLPYLKPTTFSIEPDMHCCSLNRIKYVKIEQDDQVVFLDKWEIETLVTDFLKEL